MEKGLWDRELDCRHLACPLPILNAKKMLRQMQAGERLLVRATDPASPRDFEAFARQTGQELVVSQAEGEGYVFVIRCRGSHPDGGGNV